MRRARHHTSDLESNILKRVRASTGISRVELARHLGLAPSTAGIYVERLIAEGYLGESDKAERETGRPPVLLRLNPERGEFVGVDFEARNIMAVAIDFSDKPLRNAHLRIAESDSVGEITRKIEQAIKKVMPEDETRLLAIGVGVPGLVDSQNGIALHYEYIAHWKNVPLAGSLRKKFGVPVFLENTTRTMALAELWFGQGLGVGDFLCIGIRSGIAAGMILDGRLYCGAQHASGEIGRWRCPLVSGKAAEWFNPDAKDDSAFGPELQEVASVRAIQRVFAKAIAAGEKTLLRGSPNPIPIEDIVRAVQQRDPLALLVVNEVAKCLGWAISQLLLAVDPVKIMLAGPLTTLGDHLLQPLRAVIDSAIPSEPRPTAEIINSTMGEFIGALGAAALAVHEWRPARGSVAVRT
ncbi:MAG: ROK family transcriptional regulator [Opitutaceae bacterium]|nr:ROK family transcriptional regulator [Opitutaceae bacterium]